MSIPAPDSRPVAGRYRLRTLLGQGGMGRVWAAHDEVLDRDVAVKEVLVPPAVPAGEREALLTRTLREGRAAARVRDPRVVAVYDVVEDDDRPWLVLQLLEPCSLADVLATDGPLEPARAAAIGLQVLEGLAAVHAAGVLHRDVKPANVLFGPDGGAVLADFGVATLDEEEAVTSSGLVLGSPAYLAPERARGETPSPAADLWSLGATLFAAVEGRAPFHREGPLPTLGALLTEDVPPAPAAGPLAPAIAALLTKDPAARPDADGARALLTAALTAEPLASSGGPAAVRTAAGTIDQATAPMALPVPPAGANGHEAWEVPAARVARARSADLAAACADGGAAASGAAAGAVLAAAAAAAMVPAPRRHRRALVAVAAVALLAGPVTALAERPGTSGPGAQSVGTALFPTTPKGPATTRVVAAPPTATARKTSATPSAKHTVAPAVRVAPAALSRTASDSGGDGGSTPAHQTPRVPQSQSQPQSPPPGTLGDQGGGSDKHKGRDNDGNGNADNGNGNGGNGNGGNGNGDNGNAGNGNGNGDNGNGNADNGNGNGGNGGNGNGNADNGNGNSDVEG